MSDSSVTGDSQAMKDAYNTSWFGIDSGPPSPSLIDAAVNGTDVTATDPDDPSKPAPSVTAANDGTPPAPTAVGIAATIGGAVSDFAKTLGVNTQMMQALFAQGKQAGAAQAADTLAQGQTAAKAQENASVIEQARTADQAAINKLFLGDPNDPNSNIAKSAANIAGAQNTADKLSSDLNEKAKVGFFDNPGQWFLNKVTSIGEEDRLDLLNKNIVNEQTKLKNAAGLTTDLGKTTIAADSAGLVEKGRIAAQLEVDKAKTTADAIDEKSAQTNISNLNTISAQSIAQANLAINQSRLQLDAINTQQGVIRTQLMSAQAPLIRQQIEAGTAARVDKLENTDATNKQLQAGATLLGVDNPKGVNLVALKAMGPEKAKIFLAAAEGHIGVVPGSPASALDAFNVVQPKHMAPAVTDTITKLQRIVAAAVPAIDRTMKVQPVGGKNMFAALTKPEQQQQLDSYIYSTEGSDIAKGPELSGASSIYSLPSLSTATDTPTMQKLDIIKDLQPLIANDKAGGKQYPVKAQDFLDAAFARYNKDTTPASLDKVADQVSFVFQSMVANRNAVNNYPALGLIAPNSYNATVDTKYATIPGITSTLQHIDVTQASAIKKYLMHRKLGEDPNRITMGTGIQ